MLMRIGLLLGNEPELRDGLLARLAEHAAARGEMVEVGPTADNHVGRYDVILDRISHLVPCYRAYLRAMALSGAVVVPSPMRLGGQDKLTALGLAQQLSMAAARAVLLPQQRYAPAVEQGRALGNLQFPFRFDQAAHYVGFPAELRAVDGAAWTPQPVGDLGELMARFDQSGERVLMLQQRPDVDEEHPAVALRVLCVGARGLLMRRQQGVWVAVAMGDGGLDGAGLDGAAQDGGLDRAGCEALIAQAMRLSGALGYPINAVDFVASRGQALMVDGHQPMVALGEPMAPELRAAMLDALVEVLVRTPDGH